MSLFAEIRSVIGAKQRVYQALITRFVIGRYGRENIGFMWTIVEPMVLCIGVMAIWSFTKGHNDHGLNIITFVLTGYVPLTLWRHQTGYTVNCLKHFKFLTIFRSISLFDALLSKLLLEFISVSSAGLIVFVILHFVGLIENPYDWGSVIQGWLVMGALATGAGILIAALSETTDLVERVNQPFQYFLLPFCGCFYMADWLPDATREYALFIPTLHAYEMIRGGFFGPEVRTFANPLFGFSYALVMAGLGCFLFERVKNRVGA